MPKKNDFANLGEMYDDVLSRVIVSEEVAPGEIGTAELQDGGPTEKGGFKESEVDVTKLKKGENKYNVRGYSYGGEEDPGLGEDKPQPTGKGNAYSGIVGDEDEEDSKKPDYIDLDGDGNKKEETMKKAAKDKEKAEKDEEDEETSKETEKIVQDSLNNFMATKSVFDKLYDKVMVNENFPMADEAAEDDLDALGLADAETDAEAEGDDITVTLDKDMAQALCDVLQAAIGDGGEDDDAEPEDGDHYGDEEMEEYEEDEEGTPTAMNTHYNDGKNNKVGNLKAKGAASAKGASGKVDPGSAMNTHYNDGKNNKVGNLKAGQSAFE